MDCPRCHTPQPPVAHYCYHCGLDLTGGDDKRRKSFAVKPDEPVTSFALISSIMPRGAATRPNTYRLALEISLILVALTAIVGALPIAVMLAAFAIPVVYIVYLYDVNLWEDEPITVTGAAFVLTGILAAIWTVVWMGLRGTSLPVGGGFEPTAPAPTLTGFLIVGLLAPIVGELIRQVGPLFLASRPKFDDLMDGLTFGVISGVAYATADTLVKHWPLITGGFANTRDGGTWIALLALEGFVKPLVLGTATGIACAEFSGLGKGYDGFTKRYFVGLAKAMAASVAYFGGVYLLSFIPNTTVALVVSIVWGLLILGVLIIQVRNVLHVGLMEAALESQAREAGIGPDGDLQFCPRCEMPLQPGAFFCGHCGTSLRITGHHHHDKEPAAAAAVANDAQGEQA